MAFFRYGEEEIEYLKSRDKALGAAIDLIGPIQRQVTPDLFAAQVNTIVGQQISTKAQTTIWGRMLAAMGEVTPDAVLAMPQDELQAFGISHRKAAYIRDAAEQVQSGTLDIEALREKSDEEVCRALSELRGLGVWSAEMLMIFSMQRPNILSYGDLAIHRGLRMLYRHRAVTPALFARYRRRYSPYGSVASLYLWAIAGGAVEGLTDPAPRKKK